MPDPTPAVPKATPPKQEFVDKYPYLVYTSQNTVVYSNSPETSIDDISMKLETATVTIENSSGASLQFAIPCIVTIEDESSLSGFTTVGDSASKELTIPLIGEFTNGAILATPADLSVTVTGDVEWKSDFGALEITGDGTVKVEAAAVGEGSPT